MNREGEELDTHTVISTGHTGRTEQCVRTGTGALLCLGDVSTPQKKQIMEAVTHLTGSDIDVCWASCTH